MDKVREAGAETRIKSKGGKETLLRFGGEVVRGEPEVVLADPRKVEGFKRPTSLRPFRSELYEIKYEVRDGFYTLFVTIDLASCIAV
jgi:hypothetical protein